MNAAGKVQRVEDWLENLPSQNLTAHYNAMEGDLAVECANPFTPRGFKEALQSCPTCYARGDPSTTLGCIKEHVQYFCYFCFKVMQLNSEVIALHNVVKGHFSDLEFRLVPCPFSCPDSGCFKEQFYYLSGLRSHVLKDHLPTLDRIIAATEDFGDSEKPGKADITHSSGYVSAATKESDGRLSLGNDEATSRDKRDAEETEPEQQRRPSSSFNVAHKIIKKAKKVSKLPSSRLQVMAEIESKPELKPKANCILCKVEFKKASGMLLTTLLRSNKMDAFSTFLMVIFLVAALRSHKLRQICKFFNDKFCKHCDVGFEGFSIQTCILHLKFHQEESSSRR